MTYQQCLETRNRNLHLIGTEFNSDGVNYTLEDILITPPDTMIVGYWYLYSQNHNYDAILAANRYITRTDLNIRLYASKVNEDNNENDPNILLPDGILD